MPRKSTKLHIDPLKITAKELADFHDHETPEFQPEGTLGSRLQEHVGQTFIGNYDPWVVISPNAAILTGDLTMESDFSCEVVFEFKALFKLVRKISDKDSAQAK